MCVCVCVNCQFYLHLNHLNWLSKKIASAFPFFPYLSTLPTKYVVLDIKVTTGQ